MSQGGIITELPASNRSDFIQRDPFFVGTQSFVEAGLGSALVGCEGAKVESEEAEKRQQLPNKEQAEEEERVAWLTISNELRLRSLHDVPNQTVNIRNAIYYHNNPQFYFGSFVTCGEKTMDIPNEHRSDPAHENGHAQVETSDVLGEELSRPREVVNARLVKFVHQEPKVAGINECDYSESNHLDYFGVNFVELVNVDVAFFSVVLGEELEHVGNVAEAS